jgi:hypothetical protein
LDLLVEIDARFGGRQQGGNGEDADEDDAHWAIILPLPERYVGGGLMV